MTVQSLLDKCLDRVAGCHKGTIGYRCLLGLMALIAWKSQVGGEGSELINAVRAGNMSKVRLASLNKDALSTEVEGLTPLMWAIREGHRDIAMFLIEERNAEVNAQSSRKNTAMRQAVLGRHDWAVSVLADRGACPHIPGPDDETVMGLILKAGSADYLSAALRCPCPSTTTRNSVGEGLLHQAVRWRNYAAMAMLKHDAELMEMRGRAGSTAVQYAIVFGDERACEELIGAGARLDVVDNAGRTPIELAAMTGSVHIARKLLEDYEPEDAVLESATRLAAIYGHVQLSSYLTGARWQRGARRASGYEEVSAALFGLSGKAGYELSAKWWFANEHSVGEALSKDPELCDRLLQYQRWQQGQEVVGKGSGNEVRELRRRAETRSRLLQLWIDDSFGIVWAAWEDGVVAFASNQSGGVWGGELAIGIVDERLVKGAIGSISGACSLWTEPLVMLAMHGDRQRLVTVRAGGVLDVYWGADMLRSAMTTSARDMDSRVAMNCLIEWRHSLGLMFPSRSVRLSEIGMFRGCADAQAPIEPLLESMR